MKNRRSNLYIVIYLFLTTCGCNVRVYQRQFQFKSYSSLGTNYKILYTGNGDTFSQTINQCAEFCSGDRRCVGIELCEISAILYRCRACCEWIKLEKESSVSDGNVEQCKYYEMEDDSNNVAVNKSATMVSAYNPIHHLASKAVDGITVCPTGLDTAHTDAEFMPWLKIDLHKTVDVTKVLVFNRQDNYGGRLHDLLITVGENGTIHTCGFFQGRATTGDRIIVFCHSGSTGNDVTLTIQSRKGETDLLQICEVQIFIDP